MTSSNSSPCSEIGLSRSPFTAPSLGFRARLRFLRGAVGARCLLDCMGGSSASCEHGVEDIGVVPMVVTKAELVEVQWEVAAGDLVVAPHDAPLQERPERVEILRVDNAAH